MKTPPAEWTAFTRFPTWMWRNEEVREFVDWLREHNGDINDPERRVGFYGLDLYSLFTSIDAVLNYLEDVDEETAAIARDQHMFDTLEALLSYGDQAYLIGFGTHTGTVAAATDWGDPMEIKQVQPSLTGSWERLCHESGVPAFRLPLRHPASDTLDTRLHDRRLERAIGVIYRPETERQSHYFLAQLAGQFDEYIWFDRTEAVMPLTTETLRGVPDTYPFGL